MAELHVSKKSIFKLLSEMQNSKFIIPEFQRPYKWDVEKCETLWNDIEHFAETDEKTGSDYFLGTIVSYVNKSKNHEIIDGQQRMTSFFLLLRAFFSKLEVMPAGADVTGLKNQLAPCIWDIDPISQEVTDQTKIHIESLVATEEDNKIFHDILETGQSDEAATDNYSINYRFFKKACDEYAERSPMQWKQLCITILRKCIILPIECDTSETALTIFSTLNDRGLPLADSDIFKAKIYSKLGVQEKSEFTESWKALTEICTQADMTIDDIFRYYTHILRAKEGDKSKEIGLRKFYAEESYKRLKEAKLMEEIMDLANFWRYVYIGKEPDNDITYSISNKARRYLHCLACYPNEFWKYATSVFFLKNKENESFDRDFCKMLQKLIAFLFMKFIESPTVNAIKGDIYNACITLQKNNELQFRTISNEDISKLKEKINSLSSSKISKALLLLDAYFNPNQKELISQSFEIEHIFPKKWQNTNYNGWDQNDAAEYLDRFGNKIVFEKRLNIQAGNGFFGQKKKKYSESSIACVKDLAAYPKQEWLKEDIDMRENDFTQNIIAFFTEQLAEN